MFDQGHYKRYGLPDFNYVNPKDSPFQATTFTPDTTPPELLSFMVDMNNGLLSLVFNEPVNVSSISYDSFILRSSNTNATDALFYLLTGGTTNSRNGRFVILNITESDLNDIKKIENLFDDIINSYLRFDYDAIRDMAGNSITSLDVTEALLASDFIEDMTRPSLVSFDLNMDDEVLTLHFRETVDYMTLNLSLITLQQDFNATGMNDTIRSQED